MMRNQDNVSPAVGSLWSRREMMHASAAAAGALVLGTTAAAAPAEAAAEGKAGYVDAHVHVWTPDTKRYPLAAGFKKEEMKPASFTPEELFKHAKPTGVSRIVLIQMSFYGFDNSYMLDAMKNHKGVFSGVGVIDENEKPADTMQMLAKQHVRGFRITPFKDPKGWLDGDGMSEMWKTGAKTGQAMCCLLGPENLSQVDSMCKAHPLTPVVIDHFARIGMDGTVREKDVKNLCRLAGHKQTNVKVSAYYALGKKKAPYTDLGPMIRRLLDAFGPERLMWASDCPFQVDPGHNYADSINLIKERLDYLSDGDKQYLLRKTAEQVFF